MISGIEANAISIHKEYPIDRFNWTLEFIFRQDRYSEEESTIIINSLKSLLTKDNLDKLSILLNQNTYNSALSVSDNNNKKSIVIITQVTSLGQFVNSLVHEMLHVSRHINKCDNNEELFTILGNISGDIIKELYNQ